MFYDADILEEKAFDEWSVRVNKKCVSKDLSHEIYDRAGPFLTWLKVAEEEESESEEEDDDLEVNLRIMSNYFKAVSECNKSKQLHSLKKIISYIFLQLYLQSNNLLS